MTAALALKLRSGIQVTVQNAGTTPLKSVVLHVTGSATHLGDIAPGAAAAARVRPTGESHLEIEFREGAGQTGRLNAGGYFEAGDRGTIRVSIKNGGIDSVEEDLSYW